MNVEAFWAAVGNSAIVFAVAIVICWVTGRVSRAVADTVRPQPAPGLRRCHGCGNAVFRRCPSCDKKLIPPQGGSSTAPPNPKR